MAIVIIGLGTVEHVASAFAGVGADTQTSARSATRPKALFRTMVFIEKGCFIWLFGRYVRDLDRNRAIPVLRQHDIGFCRVFGSVEVRHRNLIN